MSTTDRTMIRRSFNSLVGLLGEEFAHAHPDAEPIGATSHVRATLEEGDDRSYQESLSEVGGVVERIRLSAAYDALNTVHWLLRETCPQVAEDLWPEREFRSPACRPRKHDLINEADRDEAAATESDCRESLLPAGTHTYACAMHPRVGWARPATQLLLTARDLIASMRVDRTNP